MPLTFSALDHDYGEPDAALVATVLAGLDGKRNLVATLARDETTYLQASGSALAGFVLTYQDGSLERRYQSVDTAVPLARVTEAFHQYLRGEPGWRESFRWKDDPEKLAVTTWYESWWVYVAALAGATTFFVWLRGWW